MIAVSWTIKWFSLTQFHKTSFRQSGHTSVKCLGFHVHGTEMKQIYSIFMLQHTHKTNIILRTIVSSKELPLCFITALYNDVTHLPKRTLVTPDGWVTTDHYAWDSCIFSSKKEKAIGPCGKHAQSTLCICTKMPISNPV